MRRQGILHPLAFPSIYKHMTEIAFGTSHSVMLSHQATVVCAVTFSVLFTNTHQEKCIACHMPYHIPCKIYGTY